MSASAGWYPDPGGGENLYRYWDGKAWSAATSPNPSAPPPTQGLVGPAGVPAGAGGGLSSRPLTGGSAAGYGATNPYAGGGTGTNPYAGGTGGAGFGPLGSGAGGRPDPYAQYQQTQKKRSPLGWWVAGAALLVVLIVVAVIAVRAISGGVATSGQPAGQPSGSVCPAEPTTSPSTQAHPNDGRVHGGPVSFPTLGPPFEAPQGDDRVPFGTDVAVQQVTVEANYQPSSNWVASVLVGELQAGDGFFTPEQGAQIVVKCILGKFYGNNPVTSDVKVNKGATIDGHQAWLVESQLGFDIPGLKTKGELLIVAIVATGQTAGLFYASIPDTTPELVAPARESLKALQVDG
ncbi:MAG: hypothetical protein JWP61_1352 [Friedmanniella sp.]|nr:hypothetical protein [Friedmanniella sp.]